MRGWGWLLAALFVGGSVGTAAAASVRNPTNDSLLSMPAARQAELLATMVGHKCVGTRAFFMGQTASGPARGTAYWSLACEDGHSYAVQIARDKRGSSIAIECRALEGTGHPCFQRF